MNFLAHLHLSGNNPDLMIGNFIGDFVRGRNLAAQFDEGIAAGIELHRAIDQFTDSHEVVHQSKKRLRPRYRHYSPVIVDVFYDHFLARDWNRYRDQPLHDFTKAFYELTTEYQEVLPSRVNRMLPYMITGNWLLNYAHVEGIHQALSGMARRTPYESKMEKASDDLEKHYAEFEDEFNRFFPELENYSAEWIKNWQG